MWVMIGVAALLAAAYVSLVLLCVTGIYVGWRWWIMLTCNKDWDDAGSVIHARQRRKHGVTHLADQPAPRREPLRMQNRQIVQTRPPQASRWPDEPTTTMPRVRHARPPQPDDEHPTIQLYRPPSGPGPV